MMRDFFFLTNFFLKHRKILFIKNGWEIFGFLEGNSLVKNYISAYFYLMPFLYVDPVSLGRVVISKKYLFPSCGVYFISFVLGNVNIHMTPKYPEMINIWFLPSEDFFWSYISK